MMSDRKMSADSHQHHTTDPVDLGYVSFLDKQPFPGNHGEVTELLAENMARIESLKIQLLEVSGFDGHLAVLHEMDLLRGALMYLASQTQSAAVHRFANGIKGGIPDFHYKDLKFEGILGHGKQIRALLRIIARVTRTRLSVLLQGETGVGKELFARILHMNSGRNKFVAVNCGAFPSGIIESELFGHIKGAFTGAVSDRRGKFEEAHEGTIFLDEIGDLEMSAQVKLLRVLESGEIQRVGSDKAMIINTRVIAATNRKLEKMVSRGKFREDLFYRLSDCNLEIPPLRDRRDEIPILMEHFIHHTCTAHDLIHPEFHTDLHNFLCHDYDFPGNIRELKSLCQYLVYLYNGSLLTLEDLPARYQQKIGEVNNASGIRAIRDGSERNHLIAILSRCHGDIRTLCNELGLSRSRVYQLLQKHELDASDYRVK